MFGYRDANNYYRFSMDRERKYRRLVKVVNGVFTVLAQDSVAYQMGRWYNVQATMARGIIQILLDGQELFNVRDTSHDQGSIALYSWNNPGAEFDDLGGAPEYKARLHLLLRAEERGRECPGGNRRRQRGDTG